MARTKGNISYDCSLEDYASCLSGTSQTTELGLTILRGKNNKLTYSEHGDPELANQMYVGMADYAHLPPEKGIQVGRNDHRGGFGLLYETHLVEDLFRYYQSFGMDLRFKGMTIPGPLPATCSKPSTTQVPTITNANCETASSGWLGSGARSDEQANTGTYSWKTAAGSRAYQDVTPFVRGGTYTFKMYVYDTTAAAKISLYDGIDMTDSSAHSGSSSFEQLTVTKTISVVATRLGLYLADIADDYYDDATIALTALTFGVPQNSSCWAEFNDELYVGLGTILCKLNATGTAFIAVAKMGATITCLEPFQYGGTDYLFVGQGAGATFYYMATSELLVASTLTAKNANQFKNVTASSGTKLYWFKQPNELYSASNPLNAGSSSTVIYVGEASNNINDILEDKGTVYLPKEDQPFFIDEDDNARHLAPALKPENDTNSGKNSVVWQGNLYMPYGHQALVEFQERKPLHLSPALSTSNDSAFDGASQALAYDSVFLYDIVDNDTKVEVVAGRWDIVNGRNEWYWHPIAEITLAGAQSAYVSTVYKKRLWIGSSSAANNIYYIPLPTGYGNIVADTNLSFKSGGYFTTPWQDGNLKGDPKAWIKVTLIMTGVDATNYYTVSYQKWGDIDGSGDDVWTEIGDFGDDEELIVTKYLPVDASSNYPESEMIRFKIACTSDGAAPAPQLLFWDCRGIWKPAKKRKLITMQVQCWDKMIIKGATDDNQTEKQIRDFLWSAYDPDKAWFLKFYPPYYKSSSDLKYVKLIDPIEFGLVEIIKGQERKYEGAFNLTLEVVNLS